MNAEIQFVADPAALYMRAAGELLNAAIEAAGSRGSFTLALAGGSTPRGMYSLLIADRDIRSQFPWSRTRFFWSDERRVPPEHADSNYRMAWDACLSQAPVESTRVYRIQAEMENPEKAAIDYECCLQEVFQTGSAKLPRFDLILLGMGPDGHTASLFPGTQALDETRRLVVSNFVPKLSAGRITMTLPLLNNAKAVMFMACGADKAHALRSVLEGPFEAEQLPAQRVQPRDGRLLWLVDQAAAELLNGAGKKEAV